MYISSREFNIPSTKIDIQGPFERGAHGAIHIAKDRDDEYAVKIIPKGKMGITGILESSIMLCINHPNLNSALNVSYADPNIMIFQEKQLDDVHNYLKTNILTQETKNLWVTSLVKAIDCLHKNNIIHGDVKAKNILITHDMNIKLSDFSFSVLYTGSKLYHKVSTFTHIPLECVKRQGWSFPLDIWSLGCTMYEIQHGSMIFEFQGDEKSDLTDRSHLNVLEEKHCNCLYDWANTGPGKYDMLFPVSPLTFKPFRLSKNFILYSDVPVSSEIQNIININNTIVSCLNIFPENRPSINDIMINMGNPKNRYYTYHKKKERDVGDDLYSKVSEHIIDPDGLCMKTCKIIGRKMRWEQIDSREYTIGMYEMEKMICSDLHFRLLPSMK